MSRKEVGGGPRLWACEWVWGGLAAGRTALRFKFRGYPRVSKQNAQQALAVGISGLSEGQGGTWRSGRCEPPGGVCAAREDESPAGACREEDGPQEGQWTCSRRKRYLGTVVPRLRGGWEGAGPILGQAWDRPGCLTFLWAGHWPPTCFGTGVPPPQAALVGVRACLRHRRCAR